jgi:hypothetical protein
MISGMAIQRMSPKQVESIFRMDAAGRYGYFIEEAVTRQGVWGLFEDGWAMGTDEAGKPTFPLWPSKELALACAAGPWEGFKADEITLEDLIEELLPMLKKDGVIPSVLRSPDGKSVLPSVEDLIADLNDEMEHQD